MKTTAKLMLLLLIAGGLTLSACKKGDEGAAEGEQAETEEPTEEEGAAEEEEPAKEEEKTEEATEVDRDNYIQAAYQVACVEKVIEDVEQRKTIKTEIYARFGFDEASYMAATEQLGEDTAVNTAVETRMEECTKEVAQGFAKAGEEGEEEGEKEVKKAPAKPKPAATGIFKGELKGGVEEGTVQFRISDDFTVTGKARIKAEGKWQPISLKGKIADNKTSLTASGSAGKTNVNIKGNIKGDKLMGSVTGEAYGNGFKSNFTATK